MKPFFGARRPLPTKERRTANQLRVALFSGNYNCTRDGANQALNRLVAHLEKKHVAVRVFSPTVDEPAFPPNGTLISVPSVPLPGRREYRLASPLPRNLKRNLADFSPDIVHISAPDFLGFSAMLAARRMGIPTIASVHTRFETYFSYYGLGLMQGLAERYLGWLYSRCEQVLVPSECMADILRRQGVRSDIRYWRRGVDHSRFSPARRSMDWRRSVGLADDDVVIAFVGRVVLEKGLGAFAQAIDGLRSRGLPFRVLVIGDGPALPWFKTRMPDAIFTGALSGPDLARGFASADIFFNPSTTETFGNVNLEAMACGLPTISARASGNNSLAIHNVTGILADPAEGREYVDGLERLIRNPGLRHHMGRAGQRASLDYHWDDILDAVLQHYSAGLASFRARKHSPKGIAIQAHSDLGNHSGAAK